MENKKKEESMLGGRNIIVFFIACAFAYWQFSKAKGRAAIHSPSHQLKVSKQMLQHQLNMFEHEILDAKNTRGDNYVIIMEKIKEESGKEKDTVIQTPKVLGILVEDRVATRIYRNNKKHGRKAKGYGRSRHSSRGGRGKQPQHGRNRGQKRRRHGVHPSRRNTERAIQYEPRLKLIKYSTKLNRVEFLLVQRGLITNPLINKKDEKKNPDGKAQLESSGIQKMETKAELPEEELKAKSVKELEKRETDKIEEEKKKKNEQEKKQKEETRKAKKKKKKKMEEEDEKNKIKKEEEANDEKIIDATINSNGESNIGG